MIRRILTILWSGCFGFAGLRFALDGNWGMVIFIVGAIIALFWLVIWMIEIKYLSKES